MQRCAAELTADNITSIGILNAARAKCTKTAKGILMKKLLLASAIAALSVTAANAEIRVGVLHSTTGTMAISETTLRDVMLMLIEQQNEAGGLLGRNSSRRRRPASDWPLFAERRAS
jgi:ABC-type branched-subunit amino acid transport system substrate-binding protein